MSIQLHKGQARVIRDLFQTKTNRYAVVNASRGFGKSYLAATAAMFALQELLQMDESVPNKNIALIAPTYAQTVDIYYPLLAYTFGLEDHADAASRHMGKFVFPNKTELRLWSYEASERMRGTGQFFVVCDEVTSWQGAGSNLQESWQSVIQPCITTRWPNEGRALVISTPKGYDYFYDMFNYQDTDPQWKSYHYTYKDSPYLHDDEIERVRKTIDPLKFAREYEASFEDSGSNVFYCFDRRTHITELEPFHATEDVHVALDFNVGVMAASIFALRGDQMHFLDEFQGHPDTETLAKTLKEKYAGHNIFAYPDPSGRARKTSAATGQTDFSILQRHGIRTRAHKKAPPIVDSVAAVNKMMKTADGEVRMYFKPDLNNTIKSMERTAWLENNPDTLAIDKKMGVEHFSDGIRYATEFLFPVHAGTKKVSAQTLNF